MTTVEPYEHLSFLSSYDEEGRAAYVQALVRILAADHEFVRRQDAEAGWRIAQRGHPDDAPVWVRLKAGYAQKLVNEGILRKLEGDGEYTYYRLDVPGAELVSEVRAASEYVDLEHRNLLKDLPYW